jgi:hypothetical protein
MITFEPVPLSSGLFAKTKPPLISAAPLDTALPLPVALTVPPLILTMEEVLEVVKAAFIPVLMTDPPLTLMVLFSPPVTIVLPTLLLTDPPLTLTVLVPPVE